MIFIGGTLKKMKYDNKDIHVNLRVQYPQSDEYDFITSLERINLDQQRIEDIKSGKGFVIEPPRGIKKDIKSHTSIHSSKFGTGLDDEEYMERYVCECGMTHGRINHGLICNYCGKVVKYKDDDITKTGWIVLDTDYIIHPNLFKSLEAFVGPAKFDKIIKPDIVVDSNGMPVKKQVTKIEDSFRGIGIVGFREKFYQIMSYYLAKYPNKKNYYDDIMANRDKIFISSIPVFSTKLRPTKLDSSGSLKYEKTNENYALIARLVAECNKRGLDIDEYEKDKFDKLYFIQIEYNKIYTELKDILAKKKGDIRSAVGGRYSFSARAVIKQDVSLKPDQIKLPYAALCELLQQTIINIIVRTYSCTYSEAYKKWYKASIGYDKVIYDIIMGLINDGPGLPVLINRNPTISFGGIMFVRCVGINLDYTMSVSVLILKPLAADFDGDSLNILYLYNQDFIKTAEATISPRVMYISKNDGLCNADMIHARDYIINANSLKHICTPYSNDEIEAIRRLQKAQ